jgi:hypothetical protein
LSIELEPESAVRGNRGPGGPDPVCQATVDAIKAAGGKADYILWTRQVGGREAMLVHSGCLRRAFAGTSHTHMIESNPGFDGRPSNLGVMDVMLKWADMNISKPKTTSCPNSDGSNGNGKG